jgi:Putative MetA-pathway of phenol degradation
MMSRLALTLVLSVAAVSSAAAQGLRDKVTDLFRFGGGCTDPVCLSVDGTHGEHFNPAARTGGNNLIGFLTEAIGASIANIPLSAASGGAIWGRSPDGLPIRTATSAGPIFAERGQTLGRGRMLFAVTFNRLDYRSLRGIPLDGIVTTFPHQDTNADGLDTPAFESDVIEVRTALNINVSAVTPVLTYGLTDHIDLSVAVPLIRTALSGESEAQIIPFSNPTPHYFGTSANPLLRSTAGASGSASGIGDIAVRLKASLVANQQGAFALLGDVRLPTGKEEDFLGVGATSYSVMGIGSIRAGNFSPHLNGGYLHRGGQYQNDAILATLGFDHLMGPGATLAFDLITAWQIGDNKIEFPPPVEVTASVGPAASVRVVHQTNIPNRKDNVMMGSLGGKVSVGPGFSLIGNALVPLNQGGLQPGVAWTLGFEYSF